MGKMTRWMREHPILTLGIGALIALVALFLLPVLFQGRASQSGVGGGGVAQTNLISRFLDWGGVNI
jgi:hypothetical protein